MERRGSSKRTLILYKYLSAKKSRQDVFVTSLNIPIFNTIDTFSTGIQRFRLNRSIKQCQVGIFYTFQNISFEDDFLNFGQTEYCLNIFYHF